MNIRSIGVTLLLFFVAAEASAQKTKVRSLQWRIAGVLPSTNGKAVGFAGPVVGLTNNVLLVGGGSNFPDSMPWLGGKKKYYDDLYVFKRDHQDSLVVFKSFKLPFALAYPANVSTNRGLIVIGGEHADGSSNKVLLIQWNEATGTIRIENLPDLPFAITNASAIEHADKLYVAGGEMASEVSNHFISLDLANTSVGWKNLPSLPRPTSHSVMVIQSDGKNDCVYIMGGRKKNANSPSDLYGSNFEFDLKTNQWKAKKSLPHNLSAGIGVSYGNSLILLFGGDIGTTFHKTEELIYAINNEKDPGKGQQLSAEKIKVQSTHPGFCKQVLLYNTEKDKWKAVSSIPYDSPATTTAVKWDNEIIIPGGEIRAGVRTSQILSVKIN
jgi:N-acetylneuraminate epimerase